MKKRNKNITTIISIVFSYIILVAHGGQYVPIQQDYDGVTIGNKKAHFHLEAFYDLMCPYSTSANIVLNNVFDKIGFATQNEIYFTYHFLPLPYHYISYPLTMAQHYIYDSHGEFTVIQFQNWLFNSQNQNRFSNSITQNMTMNQIYERIDYDISQGMGPYGIKPGEIMAAISNRTYDLKTRASYKYITNHGVAGTPTFFANGVQIDGAGSFKEDDWIVFLKKFTNITLTK